MTFKNILLTILLFYSFSYGYSQNNSKYTLNRITVSSLFFIDQTESFITDYLAIEKGNFDWLTVDMKLENVDYNTLSDIFDTFLQKLNDKEQKTITQKIDDWESINTLITFPYSLNETELTENLEIISELEQTKKYVDQFIIAEGQYWGSLSTSQTTVVYFETMEHIFNMSDKEKLKFFKDYYDLAYKIGQ